MFGVNYFPGPSVFSVALIAAGVVALTIWRSIVLCNRYDARNITGRMQEQHDTFHLTRIGLSIVVALIAIGCSYAAYIHNQTVYSPEEMADLAKYADDNGYKATEITSEGRFSVTLDGCTEHARYKIENGHFVTYFEQPDERYVASSDEHRLTFETADDIRAYSNWCTNPAAAG